MEKAARLKPGQYVWQSKADSIGPVLLVIDLSAQRALLYRDGVPIAASTVSTGRAGRETPTGAFTILQKEVVHRSRTYDDAPMPYMQRLTWKGVSMHAGHLPGYPASHGCIRLPGGFAKLLYGVTKLGTMVMITDGTASASGASSAQDAPDEPIPQR
jgi:lipoprotein-anchoring transpeptidase ErfK/SrfK